MDVSARGHPVDFHVGCRIRSLRKAANMSQSELADRIGLTFQQIQKYERGFNRVSASKLYEIAQVLAVPLMDLFEGLPPTVNVGGAPTSTRQMAVVDRLLETSDGVMVAKHFPQLASRLRRAVANLVRAIAAVEE